MSANMSLTGQATSNPGFQLVINALADYTKLTGIDLTNNPFAERIKHLNSPEAVLELLREREKAFKEYRDVNRGLISHLGPAVKVFHAFSRILGDSASLVSITSATALVIHLMWPRQVPVSPAKVIFTSIDVLLTVCLSNVLFHRVPCDIRLRQAAIGVSSSYDALLELFECLGSFLKRLEIYLTIPPTTTMTDVIVQIMVEVLLVLALATKQVKQGRFSKSTIIYTMSMSQCATEKFAKKLLGDNEVEAVLQRLNRLTQDEAKMTVAQTLGVVHGLVGNMKVVMEGAESLHNCSHFSEDSIR